MDRLRSLLALSPMKIAGIYVVVSVGYIATSDTLAAWMARTQAELTTLQTLKGWAFVLLSGLLILALTSYRERQLEATRDRFRIANQHLQVLHRALRHNIRNNMNVVIGCLQLIDDHGKPSVRNYADTALEATREFCDMADKLRVVDDMDPNEPTDGPINIVEPIASLQAELQASHPGVNIETNLPATAYVHGNSGIQIILEELLTNAVEHFERPLRELQIEISVDRTPQLVTVTIADNGPGIPSTELAALRSGEETKLLHTSGAGLWLVTWLVELLGGDTRFESDESGTMVRITFPRSSAIDYVAETAQNEVPLLQPTSEPRLSR